MKTVLILVSLVCLAGCNAGVQLRHVVTGKVVTCGPYNSFGMAAQMSAVERERGCIQDYQRQGYERM